MLPTGPFTLTHPHGAYFPAFTGDFEHFRGKIL
jgi:hypothetical protein